MNQAEQQHGRPAHAKLDASPQSRQPVKEQPGKGYKLIQRRQKRADHPKDHNPAQGQPQRGHQKPSRRQGSAEGPIPLHKAEQPRPPTGQPYIQGHQAQEPNRQQYPGPAGIRLIETVQTRLDGGVNVQGHPGQGRETGGGPPLAISHYKTSPVNPPMKTEPSFLCFPSKLRRSMSCLHFKPACHKPVSAAQRLLLIKMIRLHF